MIITLLMIIFIMVCIFKIDNFKILFFNWKFYAKLLDMKSKSTCKNEAPREENQVEFLKQVRSKDIRSIDISDEFGDYGIQCNCFQYNGINYYIRSDYQETDLYIELIRGKDSIFVFANGKWLHKGVWCSQIIDTLREVHRRIKVKERVKENIIKDIKQKEIKTKVNFFEEVMK